MNLVYGPARHESYVTQWLIEHPTGGRKVIGLVPAGDSDIFLSHARDMLITSFLISVFITHMTISTLLILAVRRTHLIHEPCI